MKALKDYFLAEMDLMQRVKLKLSSADTAKAIQILQDAGYLHDSEEYMTAGEATALKRTGKVFASTNKGMLLWVTKEQHKLLCDKGVCEGLLGAGMSKSARAADVDQSDREYIMQRQQRDWDNAKAEGEKIYRANEKAGKLKSIDSVLKLRNASELERRKGSKLHAVLADKYKDLANAMGRTHHD